jgi:plastocyanin
VRGGTDERSCECTTTSNKCKARTDTSCGGGEDTDCMGPILDEECMADGEEQVIVGGFAPAATAGGQPTPQFAFTPETITAKPGDTVRFMFLGNNHSVVQTSFETPCKPLANGKLEY